MNLFRTTGSLLLRLILLLVAVLPLMGTTVPGGRYQRKDTTWMDANGNTIKAPPKSELEAAEAQALAELEADKAFEDRLQAEIARRGLIDPALQPLAPAPPPSNQPASRRDKKD